MWSVRHFDHTVGRGWEMGCERISRICNIIIAFTFFKQCAYQVIDVSNITVIGIALVVVIIAFSILAACAHNRTKGRIVFERTHGAILVAIYLLATASAVIAVLFRV